MGYEKFVPTIFLLAMTVLFLFSSSGKAYSAADRVFINGVVLTMDAENRIVQAVAVSGDRIIGVGSNKEIQTLVGPGTKVVDLDGQAMLPGFIDAHSHFPMQGQVDLYMVPTHSPPIGHMKSVDDIISALAKRAAQTPKGGWIIGIGYDDTLLAEKRHPTRYDLDRASTEHPILLWHTSLHLGVANGLALKLAGITKASPEPPGGVIQRDSDSGEPNGVLEEFSALGQVMRLLPPLTPEQRLKAIQYSGDLYARHGVTTAQNGIADRAAVEDLILADQKHMLPVRVTIWPSTVVASQMLKGAFKPQLPDDRMLTMGAVKTIADGSIQGYTGYLSKPYYVQPDGKSDYCGYPAMPRDQLADVISQYHEAGLQVAIHGNGDAAIDDIIYAWKKAQKDHPREDCRPIIVHAQMAREDQLDQMKALGMIPSFFVLHTYYWGDRHRDIFMGPERAARMSPTRSAGDRGIRYTIHADTPVVPMEPLRIIWSAVNRVSTGGHTIGLEQRVSPMEALRATTVDAAWQSFEEDIKGSVEVGKLADLVILSQNPLDVPLKIKDIEVLETIVGEKRFIAVKKNHYLFYGRCYKLSSTIK